MIMDIEHVDDPITKQPAIVSFSLQPHIRWLGYVMYAVDYQGIDPGFFSGNPPSTTLVETGIELGLRNDGVVVWRAKPSPIEK